MMSHVQYEQLLRLSLTGLGISGVPMVDPGMLGILRYGANLVPATGTLRHTPDSVMTQAVASIPTVSSQETKQTIYSNCSKTIKNPKESHDSVNELQHYVSNYENPTESDLASRNSNQTQHDATKSKSSQLNQSLSHLKCPITQSTTSSSQSLHGNKLDEGNEKEVLPTDNKRKDRSESQDSNGTASDGVPENESPVSTRLQLPFRAGSERT